MKYHISISVIMPCYNASTYIHEAINSIIEQSHKDWELIIVDDCSTDDSIKISQSFNDDRIRLYRLKKNRGNYYARNYGIKRARGKYIAMMDADDICLQHRLERQFNFLETHKHIGAIGCNYNLINEKGYKIGTVERSCNYKQFKVNLLLDNYMLQSTILTRSHLLKKYGIKYDEQFIYASDYHFVFQCSKYFRIQNIQDILLSYRINPTGITKSKFELQQQYAKIIRNQIYQYYFGNILTTTEYKIIEDISDKYCQKRLHDDTSIEALLNKILEYNSSQRKLPQKKLYNVLLFLVLNDCIPNTKQFYIQ
jgi:Glycosyltransferases involved in cell wall biogenesis